MGVLRWLKTPAEAGVNHAHLSSEPPPPVPVEEAQVRRVPPGESGEELVAAPAGMECFQVYRNLPLRHVTSPLTLRQGLMQRLQSAQEQLPRSFSLVLLDGWRSSALQRELLEYYRGQRGDVRGYVSDPDDVGLMAPHTTGGAVDVTLAYNRVPLALGTDYDDFSTDAHLLSLEPPGPVSETSPRDSDRDLARLLRRLLARVLVTAGLAPYRLEWWHWSFGEQRWAAQLGHPKTLYSPIEQN